LVVIGEDYLSTFEMDSDGGYRHGKYKEKGPFTKLVFQRKKEVERRRESGVVDLEGQNVPRKSLVNELNADPFRKKEGEGRKNGREKGSFSTQMYNRETR